MFNAAQIYPLRFGSNQGTNALTQILVCYLFISVQWNYIRENNESGMKRQQICMFDSVSYLQLYCKYYSQGIAIFLVSNGHVDSKLIIDYNWV